MTQKNNSVWILDDDRSIRWVLEKSFDKSGLATESFDNGDDLLHRLEQVQPDAIISDIRMPGISGLELLSTVNARFPELPVIIMTAYGTIDRAVELLKAGAADYVTKPFSPRELVLRFKGQRYRQAL